MSSDNPQITPTLKEVFLPENEIIVSKTDLKGRLTYANRMFEDISGYRESELMGKPHNLVRHPDMPRAIFKLLWDTLEKQREIFAYVKNITKTGDYYWVLAHVTPSRDRGGAVIGYHSNRRAPRRELITGVITPLYSRVLAAERAHRNGQQALKAGSDCLNEILQSQGTTYDAFIFSLRDGR